MNWNRTTRVVLIHAKKIQRYKEVEGDILCKIKKHESYLGIDFERLQNFNFVQSFEEGDNAEFSVINSNLFDLYLEHSDSVRDTPFASTIIDKLIIS